MVLGSPSPGATREAMAAPYAPTWDGPPGEPGPVQGTIGSGPGGVEAGPALQVPWTCDQVEYCTQGHNGGSHTGTGAWAWDFALQDGEEIWAASAGTVTHVKMDSNSGGCDSAFASQANYVTIDHGDGTSILYLHMTGGSSPLQVGDVVEVGDLVARVGETGWACGAHLHLQVQQACGSYYCQSVQASFADYGDPVANTTYVGTNCPACPAVLDGGETTIDDEDAGCLVRQTSAWWSAYEGQNDHHFYTLATAAPADDTSAVWRFGVTVPGDYEVEAFVPETSADAQGTSYRVHHEGGTTEVALDQSVAKGWQSLGTFGFVGGDGEGIELGDATGEDVSLGRRIAYDAMRFTFVPASGTTGGDETGGGSTGPSPGTGGGSNPADGGEGSGGGSGSASAGDEITSGDADAGDDAAGFATEGALPGGFGDGDGSDGGCACKTGGGAPRGLPWILWCAGLFGARRRPWIRE